MKSKILVAGVTAATPRALLAAAGVGPSPDESTAWSGREAPFSSEDRVTVLDARGRAGAATTFGRSVSPPHTSPRPHSR